MIHHRIIIFKEYIIYKKMYNFFKRICCCRKKTYEGIYTLELKNNKYYIGKSDNIINRVHNHMNGYGSSWTKMHEVVKLIPNITYNDDNNFGELIETLECINEYGINNVRGSMFTQANLSESDKIKAAELYCEMHDLCRKCGSNKHFITQCNNNTVEPWVHKFGGKLTNTTRTCVSCNKYIYNKPHYFKYCDECYRN